MEFMALFEQNLTGLEKYKHFKDELNSTFLNKQLLTECRNRTIMKKQENYFNSPKYKNSNTEKCQENSVYCFWVRGQRFSNDSNLCFRVEDLLSNLRFHYLHPYGVATPMPEAPKQLLGQSYVSQPLEIVSLPFQGTGAGNQIARMGGQITDPIANNDPTEADRIRKCSKSEIQKSPHKDKSGFNNSSTNFNRGLQTGIESEVRTEKKRKQGEPENTMNAEMQDHGERESPKTMGHTPRKNSKSDPNTHSPAPPHTKPAATPQQIEADVLMIRSEHICDFRERELQRRTRNQITQNLFFESVSQLLARFLGPEIDGINTRFQMQSVKRFTVKPESESFLNTSGKPFNNKIARLSLIAPPRQNRFKSTEIRKVRFFSRFQPVCQAKAKPQLNVQRTFNRNKYTKHIKSGSFEVNGATEMTDFNWDHYRAKYSEKIDLYNSEPANLASFPDFPFLHTKLPCYKSRVSKSLDLPRLKTQAHFYLPSLVFNMRSKSLK